MKSSFLNRVSGLLTVLVLFVAFSFGTMAQNEEMQDNKTVDENSYKQTATELTQSLSTKVNLSPEQSSEINETLVEFQKDIAEASSGTTEANMEGKISELHDNLINDVTGILDDNQLTAFNEVQSQWIQEVKNKTHSSTARQNDTKDKKY